MRVYIAGATYRTAGVTYGTYGAECELRALLTSAGFDTVEGDDHCASTYMKAMGAADAVVLMQPTVPTNFAEARLNLQAGCALGLGKPIVMIGSLDSHLDHPSIQECETNEQAVDLLLALPAPSAPAIDADAYQVWTRQTALYPATGTPTLQAIGYCLMGDVGELGEFIDKLLPAFRERLGTPGDPLEINTPASIQLMQILERVSDACKPAEVLKREIRSGAKPLPDIGTIPQAIYDAVTLEMGDRAWYWHRILDDMGIKASTVLGKNVEKLESRRKRAVLHGTGDHR